MPSSPRLPRNRTLTILSFDEARIRACFAITPLIPPSTIRRPPRRQYQRTEAQLQSWRAHALCPMIPSIPQHHAPPPHCVLFLVRLLPWSVLPNVRIVYAAPVVPIAPTATPRMVALQGPPAWMNQRRKGPLHWVGMVIGRER